MSKSIWINGGLLGEGTYAKVYLVYHKPTGRELAMKVTQTRHPLPAHACEGFINELKVLERLVQLDEPLPFVLAPAPIDMKWAWTSSTGFLHIVSVNE